ncbi:MAG: glycosyltransferase family 4 protein [Bacteroidetes bacterium]|nr:glycosyltransferase family 4 protein [Bacteroidota bacterium]
MKKIVFASSNKSEWGGSEYLWYRTALIFSEKGYDVLVTVPRWKKIPEEILRLKSGNIPLYFNTDTSAYKKIFNRMLPSSMQFDYRNDGNKCIREFSPDLTVINQGGNTGGADLMEYCSENGIKFATITQAANEAKWPDESLNKKLSAFLPKAEMNYYVSRANLKLTEIQIGQKIENAKIIYNPFNVNYDNCIKYPEVTENYLIANVARHEFYAKGQDILFRVLNEKKWRERNLTVSLYGKGEHTYQLKKLRDFFGLEKVIIRGHTDTEEIWKENHALILTSRYEGLPLALVEAMLCGRTSIVTDVSGNREVLTDGRNGFLAEFPAPEKVDEALERAWSERHRWKEIGENAREDIKKIIPADPPGYFFNELISLV